MMMKRQMLDKLEQLETLRSRAYVIDHWTGNNNSLILKIEKEINEIKKKL